MLMTHSSVKNQLRLYEFLKNICKKSKRFMKKEAMALSDTITNGARKKPLKTFYEHTLQQYQLRFYMRLQKNLFSDQESCSLLIEFSEMKHLMPRISLSFIKSKE